MNKTEKLREKSDLELETRLDVCKRAILNIRDLSPRYPLRYSNYAFKLGIA